MSSAWSSGYGCDRHSLGSKLTRAIGNVSLGKTLNGTFLCLAVSKASSSEFQAYFYKTKKTLDSNIFVSPEAGLGNCLLYV